MDSYISEALDKVEEEEIVMCEKELVKSIAKVVSKRINRKIELHERLTGKSFTGFEEGVFNEWITECLYKLIEKEDYVEDDKLESFAFIFENDTEIREAVSERVINNLLEKLAGVKS
jgi:hypothetical protein